MTTPSTTTGSPSRRARAFAALLLVLALGLAACESGETALEEAEDAGTAEGLVGEEITLSGEVTRQVAPDALIIAGDDASLGVDEGTLIYGIDSGEYAEAVDGTYVQATGTVVEFVVADVEADFGIDYDDALVADFEQEFALQATSLTAVPERGVAGDDTLLEEVEEDDNAEAVVGDPITISGEVQESIADGAFRVAGDEPGEGTLVLSADAPSVAPEDFVEVNGTVTEFMLVDIEADLGVDFDDALFEDVTDEFAVVADSVEVVPDQ